MPQNTEANLPKTYQASVIHGHKQGRTIGFPTANLDHVPTQDEIAPGVYLCTMKIAEKAHFGLAYFGPRYVAGEEHNVFEVFLYDFDTDIYDAQVSVTLTNFIRAPEAYTTMEELKTALENDKMVGRAILEKKTHE